ncbi:hypothetical protein EVAR_10560_1 [Eumeta japonica]|uniref:Uncharacterized protein n=1 Tax=Eumeta variegata TaxID=151549 RepID=A0A4C1ZMH5_EUMVA|nr:hypothetical protein EVAR_10560_1 [Eumeta japonica]
MRSGEASNKVDNTEYVRVPAYLPRHLYGRHVSCRATNMYAVSFCVIIKIKSKPVLTGQLVFDLPLTRRLGQPLVGKDSPHSLALLLTGDRVKLR